MNNLLEVKNLKKTFKLSRKQMKIEKSLNNKKVAVNDLSFNVSKGEIFGLLGPNGAGKTTALRCISTLISPDEGDVLVNGYSVLTQGEDVRKNLGFLTSELKLEDHFTPNYLFKFFAELHGLSTEKMLNRRNDLFEKFGIEKFAEVKVAELSTGMKQKLSIAISIIHDPDIIVFDEPTNGLDVLTARIVTNYLKHLQESGKTIIISTHIFSVVEKLCDRVAIIIDGKLHCVGSIESLINEYKVDSLEDLFFFLALKEEEE